MRKYTRHKLTSFESKWGITAQELAEQEDVDTTAIHMRVYLYGTPFQRANKPNTCERLFGKTSWEISQQLGIHYTTVEQRIRTHGTPYIIPQKPGPRTGNKIIKRYRKNFWLHPNHPRYAEARACQYFGEEEL